MSDIRFDSRALAELFVSTEGPIARDLARRAIQVDRMAKQLAPVDTGRLRSSITWKLGHDGLGLYAQIGSNVEYAIFQELGTSHMPAHPFLRPSLAAATR